MTWLYQQAHRTRPFPFIRRLTWMFDGLAELRPGLTDIVLDLPTGLAGFSYEVLALMAQLMAGTRLPPGYPPWHESTTRWVPKPILVTTPDRNDLFAAMDSMLEFRLHLPRLKLLVNRSNEDLESIRAAVVERYGEAADAEGLIAQDVPELRHTLGALFRERGDLDLDKDIRVLAKALGLEDEEEQA